MTNALPPAPSLISIIVPFHNEAENVQTLHARLAAVLDADAPEFNRFGAGDQRLGHRHVPFEAERFQSSGERLNLSQSSGHVYRGHPRIINSS
jgi:hypothetical protein